MSGTVAANQSQAAAPPLVDARGVTMHFPIKRGLLQRVTGHIRAVDGVNMRIPVAGSIGLVGESGSGKSTLGRCLLRLIEPTSGTVTFDGTDITGLRGRELRLMRRHMQIVFQDPYSSMAPRSTVGSSVAEPLKVQLDMSESERDDRVVELFRTVGLAPSYRSRFPHEFSGGQLQRIAVARALATGPKLVVLDEPVSALDISTRAEIINLLADLQNELQTAYLFIAHDLAVVRHVSDRIAVMYLGRIVEEGEAEVVYTNPQHPYTEALLSAIPIPDPKTERVRERIVLSGDLPSPANPPAGCHFQTRCPQAMDHCRTEAPPRTVTPEGSTVFCHLRS